ncbi:MAG: response regulator, partial [Kiritimatiellae bacterium]|nr:response regulator [Kiritimatiellia bacterium]
VLTDMKMPGMDGGAFIRAVREDLGLRALPVFLVTADIEALKYYKALSADGVLLKPVVQARLAETLSGVCVNAGEGRGGDDFQTTEKGARRWPTKRRKKTACSSLTTLNSGAAS